MKSNKNIRQILSEKYKDVNISDKEASEFQEDLKNIIINVVCNKKTC